MNGIARDAASSGLVECIEDVYDDPRFDQSNDDMTLRFSQGMIPIEVYERACICG